MGSDVYLCFMYNSLANPAYLKSLNSDYVDDENKYLPLADAYGIVYSYFMPVCSIVKTITPRCRGRPDALLHEAEGQVQ